MREKTKKIAKGIYSRGFIDSKRWPQDAKDSSSFFKALITTSESPSKC